MDITKKTSTILTATEIRRRERNAAIIAAYRELEGSYAPHRLMRVLADRFEVTITTIRTLLINSGDYTPNK